MWSFEEYANWWRESGFEEEEEFKMGLREDELQLRDFLEFEAIEGDSSESGSSE